MSALHTTSLSDAVKTSLIRPSAPDQKSASLLHSAGERSRCEDPVRRRMLEVCSVNLDSIESINHLLVNSRGRQLPPLIHFPRGIIRIVLGFGDQDGDRGGRSFYESAHCPHLLDRVVVNSLSTNAQGTRTRRCVRQRQTVSLAEDA